MSDQAVIPDPDPFEYLRYIVTQAQAAMAIGLYFPALVFALTLPDICGAASSLNGWAKPSKYKKWLRDWVLRDIDADLADLIYDFRCSLLHQGRTTPAHARLVFIEPNSYARAHRVRVQNLRGLPGVVHEFIDIARWLDEVAAGMESWIAAEGHSETVQKNMREHVKRYPQGLPSMSGVPVIA